MTVLLRRRKTRLEDIERGLTNGTWLFIGYSTFGDWRWGLGAIAVWVARLFVVRRLELVNAELEG